MFDWLTDFILQSGYIGIMLLMLAENLFPPIPSELIMPLAGFAAARGDLNIALVIAAGSLGSLFGAIFWYYIGKWIGGERVRRWAANHGRWLTISPGDVDRAQSWFLRHGGKAVFLGRLVPAVRSLISIPAGIAEMALPRFLIYSASGTILWSSLLAVAGYFLENSYDAVADYVNPVSNAVVGLIIAYYLYRVVIHRGRREAP